MPNGCPANLQRIALRTVIKLVAGATSAIALLALAPIAHADNSWTVQQICDAKGPNLVAMQIFASPEVTCADPAYWAKTGTVPGLFIAAPPSIPRIMELLRPGSYSTDPGNGWADWMIPDGSQPAPPRGPEPYMWQTDPGAWQGPCPPTCPKF